MKSFPIKIADKNTGEWQEHPRFKNIMINTLLTRQDNALANVNSVRVPTGGVISTHIHAGQVETIMVLAGRAVLTVAGVESAFTAGQIVAVPGDVDHSLRNEGSELVELLTIFTPPM
jgi:mannose-6-phosphate isomerase-like protein (cupin superfamily)